MTRTRILATTLLAASMLAVGTAAALPHNSCSVWVHEYSEHVKVQGRARAHRWAKHHPQVIVAVHAYGFRVHQAHVRLGRKRRPSLHDRLMLMAVLCDLSVDLPLESAPVAAMLDVDTSTMLIPPLDFTGPTYATGEELPPVPGTPGCDCGGYPGGGSPVGGGGGGGGVYPISFPPTVPPLPIAVTPEPGSLVLLGTGMIAVALTQRKRRTVWR